MYFIFSSFSLYIHFVRKVEPKTASITLQKFIIYEFTKALSHNCASSPHWFWLRNSCHRLRHVVMGPFPWNDSHCGPQHGEAAS